MKSELEECRKNLANNGNPMMGNGVRDNIEDNESENEDDENSESEDDESESGDENS